MLPFSAGPPLRRGTRHIFLIGKRHCALTDYHHMSSLLLEKANIIKGCFAFL